MIKSSMLKGKTHNNSDELLLCFDGQGNIIAPQPRDAVHKKPYRIWHAITNIWVLNSKGEILCTRRASRVSGNPGMWQTYVGGHVKANATFSETARRELVEEIGLNITDDNLKLVEKGHREDTMHVYESYAILFNGDSSKFNFSDGEVSEAQWFRFEKYQQLRKENPGGWCNGMKPEQYQKASKTLGL